MYHDRVLNHLTIHLIFGAKTYLTIYLTFRVDDSLNILIIIDFHAMIHLTIHLMFHAMIHGVCTDSPPIFQKQNHSTVIQNQWYFYFLSLKL